MSLLHELIPRIARRRLKFYQGVTRDDLEAEMWLAAVEDATTINTLAATAAEAAVEVRLTRVAARVQAGEEREHRARRGYAAGYLPHDEQFYSVGALRRLLPAYLDGGVSEAPPQAREDSVSARPTGSIAYGDWLIMMVDLDTAMGRVKPYHRNILGRYFAYPQGSSGWTHEQIAGALGIEPEALRKRVYRALRAVQGELGGQSPYTGNPAGEVAGLRSGGA